MSTFNSQSTDLSTSTTSSASRFSLSPSSTSPILVYTVRQGYTISTESDLIRDLDASTSLRLTRKPISRTTSRIDVQAQDLQYEDERKYAEEMRNPQQTASVASIGLSPGIVWRKRILGMFGELFIVSPESGRSESGSATGTLNSSGSVSPEEGPTRSGTGEMDGEAVTEGDGMPRVEDSRG